MTVMSGESRKTMDDGPVDAQSYARSILNIMDDFGSEQARLNDTQRAILNILEDSAGEKFRLEATQRAVLNILNDSAEEKARLESTQKAVLNILNDFGSEQARLNDTQRATLNILEDSAVEKTRLEATQRAVLNILEDFNAEKFRMGEGQRAMINILEDFDAERAKVAAVNQQLATANKELDAFSYSVSHDLRAPLRAIDGFSHALLEDYTDRLDDKGRDYLQRVRAGSQRMSQLIDDMLKLSRLTRAELSRDDVDISAIAQEIAAELSRAQPDREVEFVIASSLRAYGDSRLLRIVIENLFNNAFKFTRPHPGARIEFGVMEDDGKSVYFVRDDGVGFNMAYADKLFGAFQRLHDTRDFPGTGIGLATVQRVIHRHGGKIWAEGEMEKGASFYFTLPR